MEIQSKMVSLPVSNLVVVTCYNLYIRPKGLRNGRKTVVTFTSNPTHIRSGNLPPRSLERYRYITLFGDDDDDDDVTGTKLNLNSNENNFNLHRFGIKYYNTAVIIFIYFPDSDIIDSLR
jgi:hypothetical protein